MAVILQVTGGPGAGRKTFLRAGQVLRVGRTEWAEFNIPQDTTLAPIHFSLEFDSHACRVRALQNTSGILVNGLPVADAIVGHGDRITAGATTFSVHIDGHAPVAPLVPAAAKIATVAAAAPPGVSSGFVHIATPLAAAVCEKFDLDDAAKKLLEPQHTVRQFFTLLVKQQLYADATRLLAHALPKGEAIWWGCRAIRSAEPTLSSADKAALGVAERWVEEPTEPNRRSAQTAAEATGYETACGWAAGAAFWSGGSMGPPDLPEVPPKETLTAQAVVVAITLTAAAEPAKTASRFAEFLSLGSRVADGQDRWPKV